MAYFKPQEMKTNGRFYPVAVLVDRPMEIDELAQQIAEASTVSKADALATLTALSPVMARGMNAGRSVHLPEIGFFRLTADAKKGGRATAKEVSASDIERARVRFTPETRVKNGATTRGLSADVHWTRWDGTSAPDGTDAGDEEEDGGSFG